MTTDITELAQRMKAAAGKATQGEWWADEVKNEGCYGSGDDCVEGFTSYAIYGSDGQTLFDSLNSDAACICEEYDGEGHVAWDETAQSNAEFIALANPNNVIALVEALEKSEKTSEARREAIDRTHNMFVRERDRANAAEEALEKAQAINAAAEKLVRCKGRYHSEQNYRALAALFGVKTPDLPPLEHENVHYADAAEMEIAALRQRIAELESRTVTFKLPFTPEPSAFAPWVAKAFYQFHKDTVKSCVAVFSDACATAGIKVEAE
ncbi:ead/Ea22-like family protein [Klebsiella pneumoniae]|uniref:ead/Ea22-like family protein n=1 Tax=Klebsiella pneumoniae TaxID=573 RepID=UPI0032FC6DA0|nr:ead/Ea22-like family protein [Klebsiella pneumoniae]HBW8242589.1 ead/Ea22-like family protein [Klebsiella pneumoniae]